MTFKSKKFFYRINGQKGGRPKSKTQIYIKLPEIKFVHLTPDQYKKLTERYGCKILWKALFILDSWLSSGSPIAEKYIGKNNYAHFRSDGWVINEAIKISQQY